MGADAIHGAIVTHRICGGFSDIRSCRDPRSVVPRLVRPGSR
jgi:hypothetical protein